MNLNIVVTLLAGALSPTPDFTIKTLEPREDDEKIYNITQLRAVLNATSNISLHIIGIIRVSQDRIVISTGMKVTLWGEGDAALDAFEQAGTFPGVLDVSGSLYLKGVAVRGATRSVGWIGGCIRTRRQGADPWLMISESRISDCEVAGGGGGGLLVLAGKALVTDTVFERTAVTSTQANTRGGGAGVQNGMLVLRNVRFINTSVSTEQAVAYGGGLAVWGRGAAYVENVSFTHCTATSVYFQAFGGGLGMSGGSVDARTVLFDRTSVSTSYSTAFGGGLGMDNGHAEMMYATFLGSAAAGVDWHGVGGGIGLYGGKLVAHGLYLADTSATSLNHEAVGGAVGVYNGASARLFDAVVLRALAASTHGPAFGGVAGVHMPADTADSNEVSDLRLANFSVVDTQLHSSVGRKGLIIHVANARLTTTVLSIRHACPATEAAHLIDGEPAGLVLPLLALTLDVPDCPPVLAPTLDALSCTPEPTPPLWRPDVCGRGATCVMSEDGALPTPSCACERPAFISPTCTAPCDAALAPYSDGCIVPLRADTLVQISSETTASLTKTRTTAHTQELELAAFISGTEWDLVGFPTALPWRAWLHFDRNMTHLDPRLVSFYEAWQRSFTPWMQLHASSGNLSRPSVIGSRSAINLRVNVSTAGLWDFMLPFTARVDILIELPTPQHLTLPVQLFLAAEPVPSKCTLTEGTAAYVKAEINEQQLFQFLARDLEGLPIARSGFDFEGVLSRCLDLRCSQTEALNGTLVNVPAVFNGFHYEATYTLTRLGPHQIIMRLGGAPLNFTIIANGVCGAGYFTSGHANLDPTRECVPCPVDKVECEGIGETIETLHLQRNYWRASNRTTDIRMCKMLAWRDDEATPCAGSRTRANESLNQSRGGYCEEGHYGPLCRACVEADHYYDMGGAACTRCLSTGVAALWLPMAVLSLVCLVGALAYLLWEELQRWGVEDARFMVHISQARQLWAELGMVAKLKVAIGYFQVILQVPIVYDVPLPHEYYAWVGLFSFASLDWLGALVPAGCVGGYRRWLALKATSPLLALLIVFAGAIALEVGLAARRPSGEASVGLATQARQWSWLRQTVHSGFHSGVLRVLPLLLVCLFSLVPTVSNSIFSAFSCEDFGYDDIKEEIRWYLLSNLAIECEGPAYKQITSLAYGLMVLWPIGVPLLFCFLLLRSREAIDNPLAHAVAFLHAEYREGYFFWELLELMRKLTLTGFLLFIPQQLSMLRLVIALLLSIGHMLLLQQAAPFKQRFTAYFAVATSLTLVCSLLMALLIKVYERGVVDDMMRTLGVDTPFPLTVAILLFNFSVLLVALTLICFQAGVEKRRMAVRRLRYQDGRFDEVHAPRIHANEYHLFLSHAWGTGQDQMRIVKQRLAEMVPDMRTFLDVDDLQDTDLESYINRSHAVLVFCSAGYCQSKNCLRELTAAVARQKKMIALLEPDGRHGGVTQLAMCGQLEANSHLVGGRGAPSGAALATALFAEESIEWNRLGPYQDVTLRLIAQRLLPHPERATYVQGELIFQPTPLLRPTHGRRFHLYASPSNAGAEALLAELAHARSLERRLRWTGHAHHLEHCNAMLLYLSAATWTRGAPSAQLAHEVEEAMRCGVRLLLAHEVPGLGQAERQAIEFDELLQPHHTPGGLMAAGVYHDIAVPLKGGQWRYASMALLGAAIAEGQGLGRAFGPDGASLVGVRKQWKTLKGLLPWTAPTSRQSSAQSGVTMGAADHHPSEASERKRRPPARPHEVETPSRRLLHTPSSRGSHVDFAVLSMATSCERPSRGEEGLHDAL